MKMSEIEGQEGGVEGATGSLSQPRERRWQKRLRPWVLNGALILICCVVSFPIFSTVLLSVKASEDVRRRPPVLLPCDSETAPFNPLQCRFALDGYRRVLLLRPD